MAILVPGHFARAPAHLPAATATTAAAAATAATATGTAVSNPPGTPQGAQSTAPAGSRTQDGQEDTSQPSTPLPTSQQPSVQNRRRRTEVMPNCIANARPKRTRKKMTPESDSLNAPYVKLTPILDIDPNAMDIDEVKVLRSGKSKAADVINDPIICCIYCHDIGSYMWTCQVIKCGNPVCVSLSGSDLGCLRIWPDPDTGAVAVTEDTFMCPRCHRDSGTPMPYKIQGYSVRQDFLFRNYFPLLAVFLSWSGFGSPYAANVIKMTLEEHYRRDKSRLRIATRSLKAGNNIPGAMTPAFDWMKRFNYEGNLLICVNTHSDTETGFLVVSGTAENPGSVPINELLSNYIGDSNLKDATHAISAINKTSGAGPCYRGLVICCCGATGRLSSSANLLKRLVHDNIFDFVLTFAGVSTLDPIVVPALNRFIENVYIYDLAIWDALEESFGEDRHALNQTPVFLSYADIRTEDNVRRRIVHTRVLAYSNLKDGRPWGLDIYRCGNQECQAPAYNMIFHPHGKQWYGNKWLNTRMKYLCMQCNTTRKSIACPTWIHAARTQNYGRVWYEWPLSKAQERDIGIIS